MKKKMHILVAASDPGGGNAVFPVARLLRRQGHRVDCVIEAASRDIFKQEKIFFWDAKNFSGRRIHKLFQTSYDAYVFGVSGGRDKIEKKILHWAHKCRVPSVAVMDFWSNYWERFLHHQKKNVYLVPDYICVIDQRMRREMIKEGFAREKIFITGNPYFNVFLKGLTRHREDPKRLLFISQPFANDIKGGSKAIGFTEYSVLEDVLKVLKKIKSSYQLVIRLHPREPRHKFDHVFAKRIYPARYDTSVKLSDSLSRARIILGMSSTVLFQASLIGKSVISYQPGMKHYFLPVDFGRLSQLATAPRQLEKLLKTYYSSKRPVKVKKPDALVPQATENVVKVIKWLKESAT